MVRLTRESERDPPPYTSGRTGDNGNWALFSDVDYSAVVR
jgi:hypothetical protein